MSTTLEYMGEAAPGQSRFGDSLLELVGEGFLFTKWSYGAELVLHFGELLHGPPRTIRGQPYVREYGSHSIHTRGSAWLLKSGIRMTTGGLEAELDSIATRTSASEITQDNPIQPGAVVTAVKPFVVDRPGVKGIGLRIALSDGTTLIIIPTPPEPATDAVPPDVPVYEVADWEIDTPKWRMIVGPGMKWTREPKA